MTTNPLCAEVEPLAGSITSNGVAGKIRNNVFYYKMFFSFNWIFAACEAIGCKCLLLYVVTKKSSVLLEIKFEQKDKKGQYQYSRIKRNCSLFSSSEI